SSLDGVSTVLSFATAAFARVRFGFRGIVATTPRRFARRASSSSDESAFSTSLVESHPLRAWYAPQRIQETSSTLLAPVATPTRTPLSLASRQPRASRS